MRFCRGAESTFFSFPELPAHKKKSTVTIIYKKVTFYTTKTHFFSFYLLFAPVNRFLSPYPHPLFPPTVPLLFTGPLSLPTLPFYLLFALADDSSLTHSSLPLSSTVPLHTSGPLSLQISHNHLLFAPSNESTPLSYTPITPTPQSDFFSSLPQTLPPHRAPFPTLPQKRFKNHQKNHFPEGAKPLLPLDYFF